MKFIDILPEIQKGRAFKCPSWERYSYLMYLGTSPTGDKLIPLEFLIRDLIRDDFELEPISKTITKADLHKAWNELRNENAAFCHHVGRSEKSIYLDEICKKLGL
jgi:hypothetical protein